MTHLIVIPVFSGGPSGVRRSVNESLSGCKGCPCTSSIGKIKTCFNQVIEKAHVLTKKGFISYITYVINRVQAPVMWAES
jgi:hypothetical protein